MKANLRLLSLALVVGLGGLVTAQAADKEMTPIIKHLKTHYKAKHRGIPLMGLARFAVRIIRPAGVKSIKLEIFEDLQFDQAPANVELNELVRSSLDASWRPLVRVYARPGREQTYVYVKEENQKDLKLMVVTLDQENAVVLRVKLNTHALVKFMENPKILGISLGRGIIRNETRPEDKDDDDRHTTVVADEFAPTR